MYSRHEQITTTLWSEKKGESQWIPLERLKQNSSSPIRGQRQKPETWKCSCTRPILFNSGEWLKRCWCVFFPFFFILNRSFLGFGKRRSDAFTSIRNCRISKAWSQILTERRNSPSKAASAPWQGVAWLDQKTPNGPKDWPDGSWICWDTFHFTSQSVKDLRTKDIVRKRAETTNSWSDGAL